MGSLTLLVKCPTCGATRKTSSLRRVACFLCGRSYAIFNKRTGRSNVVKIINGNRELLTKRLYQMGIYGNKKK